MNQKKLETVKAEMARLSQRIEEYEAQRVPEVVKPGSYSRRPHWSTVAESGAVKRASLDLTRALADLRRPA